MASLARSAANMLRNSSVTEILDVAPIDLLNGLTSEFVKDWPHELMSASLQAQSVDIKFHWVTETGKSARLTSGMSITATVSKLRTPPMG